MLTKTFLLHNLTYIKSKVNDDQKKKKKVTVINKNVLGVLDC